MNTKNSINLNIKIPEYYKITFRDKLKIGVFSYSPIDIYFDKDTPITFVLNTNKGEKYGGYIRALSPSENITAQKEFEATFNIDDELIKTLADKDDMSIIVNSKESKINIVFSKKYNTFMKNLNFNFPVTKREFNQYLANAFSNYLRHDLMNKLDSKLDKLNKEKSEINEKLKGLEGNINNIDENLKNLIQKNEIAKTYLDLKESIDKINKDIDNISNIPNPSKINDKIDTLDKEIENIKNEIKDTEDKIKGMPDTDKSLDDILADYNKKIAKLDDELEMLSLFREIFGLVNHFMAHPEDFKETMKRLQEISDKMKSINADLARQLLVEQKDISKKMSDIDKLLRALFELMVQMKSCENDRKSQRCIGVWIKFERVVNALKRNMDEYLKMIDESFDCKNKDLIENCIDERIEQIKKEKEDLIKKRDDLIKDLSKKQGAKNALKEKLNELNNEKNKKLSEKNSLIEEKSKIFDKLMNFLKTLNDDIDAYYKVVEESKNTDDSLINSFKDNKDMKNLLELTKNASNRSKSDWENNWDKYINEFKPYLSILKELSKKLQNELDEISSKLKSGIIEKDKIKAVQKGLEDRRLELETELEKMQQNILLNTMYYQVFYGYYNYRIITSNISQGISKLLEKYFPEGISENLNSKTDEQYIKMMEEAKTLFTPSEQPSIDELPVPNKTAAFISDLKHEGSDKITFKNKDNVSENISAQQLLWVLLTSELEKETYKRQCFFEIAPDYFANSIDDLNTKFLALTEILVMGTQKYNLQSKINLKIMLDTAPRVVAGRRTQYYLKVDFSDKSFRIYINLTRVNDAESPLYIVPD